jgi:adenylyltransferase/sulfurtransferase
MTKKRNAQDGLSKEELSFYARQMLIEEWRGASGQLALKRSSVLVVGAGGSGSPLLYYLAAAGIGRIRICDGDKVELTNLNRQILHNIGRIGKNKAASAKATLSELNRNIEIEAIDANLDERNCDELAAGCDIICCAADDRTKHKTYSTLNEYSHRNQTPIAWAGGYYMGGFATFILPPLTPCMDCFLARNDADIEAVKKGLKKIPDEAGRLPAGANPIVGAAAGMAGSIQAMEVIKYLVGIGDNLRGRMLLFQMRKGVAFVEHDMEQMRRPGCKFCGG